MTKDGPKSAGPTPRKTPACAICGKPRDIQYRPFCSKRCADLDLGRWLNGSYAIPVSADDDEDGEDATPPEPKPARNGESG